MKIGQKNFLFRDSDKPVVIAEAGSNHNGDLEIAKKMVDVAKVAGADIVKFQAFKSTEEISRFAAKAGYQKCNTSLKDSANQLELCQSLELSHDNLRAIKNYCDKIKIPFLCAAFESDSLNFLVNKLKVKSIKVPSSEITNLPFLKEIGSKKIGVILSTGGSTLTEVGLAIEALGIGSSTELVLLHCVSDYPASREDLNLRTIQTMKQAFGLPVGFSDHSQGIGAPIVAVTLGAMAIEKHFTLDRKMSGPDHRASLEPDELALMVKEIHFANQSLGSGNKVPVQGERANVSLIRKSLVARRNLKKGQMLKKSDIAIKRPEGGIAPADWEKIIGLTLNRDLSIDEFIKWKDLK